MGLRIFLPCCLGGCLGGCVGGGRHVDDKLGEDVRREEVDADADDQLITVVVAVAVAADQTVLDARLGTPLLGTLERGGGRGVSWPSDLGAPMNDTRKIFRFLDSLPLVCTGQ